MTTIAYKDGIIAYDSLATRGDEITSYSANKRIFKGGVNFFLAGSFADYGGFVEAYLAGKEAGRFVDICALIVKGGIVYNAGAQKREVWSHKVGDDYSIGSGSRFAVGAMEAGASAKEAVRMAARRDTHTGGRIRTFKIKGN